MSTRFNSLTWYVYIYIYIFPSYFSYLDSTSVMQSLCNSNICVPFRNKISHNKSRKSNLGLGDLIDSL